MKKRILIIEDDADIRAVVCYILENAGYEVIAATPGPAHEVPTYKADLILLDEWLHQKEGHMLCNEIKEIHEIRHLPVIILSTANNIAEIARTCKADGYISKPFEIEELLHEVEKCLGIHDQSAVSEY